MKIPFSLEKYRQHPDWKIETRDGRDIKILYTDRLSERCIIALVNGVTALYYYENGRGNGAQGRDCEDDLFFITEDKLSAFEKKLAQIISSRDGECAYSDEKLTASEVAHLVSEDLLELAKKEIVHDDDDEIIKAIITYFSDDGMAYNELCNIMPRLTTDKVIRCLEKKLRK